MKELSEVTAGRDRITAKGHNAQVIAIRELQNLRVVAPLTMIQVGGSWVLGVDLRGLEGQFTNPASPMVFSDESDAGAIITAVDGLLTIDCSEATGVLKDLGGTTIYYKTVTVYETSVLTGTFGIEVNRVKACLFCNGQKMVQVDMGDAVVVGVNEWALDTTSGGEKFVFRKSLGGEADNHDYEISMFGSMS